MRFSPPKNRGQDELPYTEGPRAERAERKTRWSGLQLLLSATGTLVCCGRAASHRLGGRNGRFAATAASAGAGATFEYPTRGLRSQRYDELYVRRTFREQLH